MEKDLIKQFNLPSYVKNKTYADASKAIEKKFKDRTDATAQQTKEELLGRLAKAQEYTKMQEALAANASQVPDMMGGDIPAGMEEFMPQQNQAFLGGMFGQVGLEAAGGVKGIAGEVTDIAGSLIGGGNKIDTSGAQTYDAQAAKNARTQGAIGGGVKAITGALTGNPVDLVSGLFGVGKSIIGGKKEQEEINQANVNSNLAGSAHLRSDFAYGGKVNEYAGDDPKKSSWMDQDFSAYGASMAGKDQLTDLAAGYALKPKVDMTGAGTNMFTTPDYSATDSPEETKTGAGRVLDWLGENGSEIGRLAPIIGNLTNKLEKPTTEAATKIIGRHARKPLDTQNAINRINQATNEQRLASELSGGDLGAARNMATVLDLNTKRGISDASYKGDVGERDEQRFGTQVDQRNAQFNAMQDERYIDRKARDTGAYNTAKQAQRTALYEDAGALARELGDKNTIKEMFGYKWNGKYWTDKSGTEYTTKEMSHKIKSQYGTPTNTTMFGGYLKK